MADGPTYSSVTPGGVFDFQDEFTSSTTGGTGTGGTGADGSSYDTINISQTAADVTLTFSDSTGVLPDRAVSFNLPAEETAEEILNKLNAYTGIINISDDLLNTTIARITDLATATGDVNDNLLTLTVDGTTYSIPQGGAGGGNLTQVVTELNTTEAPSSAAVFTFVDAIQTALEAADATLDGRITTEAGARNAQDIALGLRIDGKQDTLNTFDDVPGLTTELATKQDTLTDYTPTVWTAKQDALPAYDTTPTALSTNLVTSGGVQVAIASISGNFPTIVDDEAARLVLSNTPEKVAALATGQLVIQQDTDQIYYWDVTDTWVLTADIGLTNIEDLNDVEVTGARADIPAESVLVWSPTTLEADGTAGTWINTDRDDWLGTSNTILDIIAAAGTEATTRADEDTVLSDSIIALGTNVRAEFANADADLDTTLRTYIDTQDNGVEAAQRVADATLRQDFQLADTNIITDYEAADTTLQTGIDDLTDLVQDNYVPNSRIEVLASENITTADVYSTGSVDALIANSATAEVLFLYGQFANFAAARGSLDNVNVVHENGVYTVSNATSGALITDFIGNNVGEWHESTLAGDNFALQGVNTIPGDPVEFHPVQLGVPGPDGSSIIAIWATDDAGAGATYTATGAETFIGFHQYEGDTPAIATAVLTTTFNSIEGPRGVQGIQGPYLVYLYQQVVQAGGVSINPGRPVATFDGTDYAAQGDWVTAFPGITDGSDTYQSFALYDPGIGGTAGLGTWATPFVVSAVGPSGPQGPRGTQLERYVNDADYEVGDFVITSVGSIALRLTDGTSDTTPTETTADWLVNVSTQARIEDITTTATGNGQFTYNAVDGDGNVAATWTTGGVAPTPGVASFRVELSAHTLAVGSTAAETLTLGVSGSGFVYTGHGAITVSRNRGGTVTTSTITARTNTVETISTTSVWSTATAGDVFTISGNINYSYNGVAQTAHPFSTQVHIATAPAHILTRFVADGSIDTQDGVVHTFGQFTDTGVVAQYGAGFHVPANADGATNPDLLIAFPSTLFASTVGIDDPIYDVPLFFHNQFGRIEPDDGYGWISIDPGTGNYAPVGFVHGGVSYYLYSIDGITVGNVNWTMEAS